jgi:hypothetical protein
VSVIEGWDTALWWVDMELLFLIIARIGADHFRVDESTWPSTLQELVAAKTVEVGPYDLELDYNYWGYREFVFSVICAVLERH